MIIGTEGQAALDVSRDTVAVPFFVADVVGRVFTEVGRDRQAGLLLHLAA